MRFKSGARRAIRVQLCLAGLLGFATCYVGVYLSGGYTRPHCPEERYSPKENQVIDSAPGTIEGGPRNLTDGLIEWLHIPKAGTSFGNTLLLWACPELNASTIWVQENRVLPLPDSCLAKFRKSDRKGWPIGNHVPLTDRTDAELHNVFTLVRHPKSRAVSGFHYLTDYKRVGATRFEICAYVTSKPEAHVNLGAQVKFITGDAEFTWPSNYALAPKYAGAPPDSMVDKACARLQLFAFVGLSEHWNASVCLFHAMFGGQTHKIEYANVRKGKYGGVGLFGELDCGDTADERLYACAKEIFVARLEQHPQCIRQL